MYSYIEALIFYASTFRSHVARNVSKQVSGFSSPTVFGSLMVTADRECGGTIVPMAKTNETKMQSGDNLSVLGLESGLS